MTDVAPEPQTIGEIRQQLATCQTDLGGAIDQLKAVEAQLLEVGDETAGFVATLREQLSSALVKLQPVINEISAINEDDLVTEHAEKFEKIEGFFEEIQGLQNQI